MSKGKRFLALLLSIVLTLSLCSFSALADDASVASVTNGGTATNYTTLTGAVEAAQSGDTITLLADVDMAGTTWTPLVVAKNFTLTIDGGGHTISNMNVVKGSLKPSGTGVAGDGGSCDYYAGFVGNNNGTLTINNLKFSGAIVDINPTTAEQKSTGSSILAVVCANNMGTLVYNNVDVDDSTVRGYTKAGILHGFTQAGSFVANHCAITNSHVELEADGTDPEAAFSGLIIGYDGKGLAKTNGIKLSGSDIKVNGSVWRGTPIDTAADGTRTINAYNSTYGLTSPTYAKGDRMGVRSLQFAAEVDGYQYETLKDAVAAAKGGTVKLLADVSEDVVIPSGTAVTLDLNGHTLTGAAKAAGKVTDLSTTDISAAIKNHGTLTIKDSSAAKTGTVKAAGYYDAAVYNAPGATAELAGGTYNDFALKDTATAYTKAGGTAATSYAGWYIIQNLGTMVIKSGVTVANVNPEKASDTAVINGVDHQLFASDAAGVTALSGAASPIKANAVMDIQGGTFTSGLFVVKNGDWYAQMTIENGTFSAVMDLSVSASSETAVNGACLSNSNNCALTVTGGTFTSKGDVPTVKCKNKSAYIGKTGAEDLGLAISGGAFAQLGAGDVLQTLTTTTALAANQAPILNVTGGFFTGAYNTKTEADKTLTTPSYAENDSKLTVAGGYFTADPSAYVRDEAKVVAASDLTNYTYMIGAKLTDVKVAAGEPTITADTTGKTQAVADAIDDVVDAMTEDKPTQSGLESAAGKEAAAITQGQLDAGTTKLTDAGVTVEDGDTVTLFVEPYLDVKVTDAVVDGNGKVTELTLDISARVAIIASTAENAQGIETDGTGKNAVKVGDEKLTVTKPVTITVSLGKNFTEAATLTVKHVKSAAEVYYYTATITTDAVTQNQTATFIDLNGFSEFSLKPADMRQITVDFGGVTKTYSVTDVGSSLPAAEKSGNTYTGWKIGGAVYTKLTDALWQQLLANTDVDDTTPVTVAAEAQFTYNHSKFTVTSEAGAGGTITPSGSEEVDAGGSLTFTITPDAGYVVKDVLVDGKSVGAVDTYTFTDVILQHTISATFDKAADLTITASAGEHGAISPSGDVTVKNGADQAFTITASAGYKVADVLVDGVSVGAPATYTFEKVTKNHTIAASFVSTWANPYKDVSEKNWFYGAVRYATEKGLFDGMADDTFAPDVRMTRGMLVTVLWRMEGKPTAAASGFADVPADQWYAGAVAWAASKGIVDGYSATEFRPDTPVTREQMAAILYRYAVVKGYDVTPGSISAASFSDYGDVSSYAVKAISWAVSVGLMDGVGGNKLDPQGNATRAQVAKLLMGFQTYFGK